MSTRKLLLTVVVCACAGKLRAAELKGTVIDPAGRPIPGARVAATTPLGIITQQITDDHGRFDIYVSPLYENVQLRVTAPGFQTTIAGMGASRIQLALAPQTDSVRVTASALDVAASEQGSSVSVITSRDLRERNEAQAADLLREIPGVQLEQGGPRGSVTDLFVRGGDSKYNLVLLNGIPINSFYYGGLFDFAQIPSDFIEEIDVARGPQSAVYGSYALGSVVNFVTRSPQDGPAFDVLAEGGTHDENRVALSGSGMVSRDFGLAGSISSLNANGPVPNSDYRNDNVFLSASYRWRTQNFYAFGNFNSNDVGEPGPFGSNPLGLYKAIDTVSRSKNNTSAYAFHWQDEVSDKLRTDIFGGFFLNNSLYISPYGDSFNKDLRGYAEGRATYVVTGHWSMAGGYVFNREEMKNTYVTDTNGRDFLLRRDNSGVYWENRFSLNRLYINVGVREEIYQTPAVPGDAYGFPPRPDFPARTDTHLSPKIAGAYSVDASTRLHASYGTGIRPPGGSDLAFTDNPALKPERTESYDAGIEKRFLNDRLSVDGTWFHNRYRDMIVALGGSLSTISRYYSDNLANARAQGAEATAQFRPTRWVSVTGNYMWLDTKALALNGGSGLIQKYFYLGQPLLRRPKQSGSLVMTFHYKRVDTNLVGYFRGRSLDVEPSYGASAGLFRNPGYENVGVNVNFRVKDNVTFYANLRNALNERYEEIYGFPSPLLNVVAGVKWSLARSR
ncbi:MAG TPA: TonB-dependent receptor [Bryobacteraceae bacterium]|nr:TonB-dependent receptor [Bryobacteraceae bacterium]